MRWSRPPPPKPGPGTLTGRRNAPRGSGRRVLARLGVVGAVFLLPQAGAHAAPPNPGDQDIEAAQEAADAQVDAVAALVGRIARADDSLTALDREIATKREAVNKAVVDLQSAEIESAQTAAEVEKLTAGMIEASATIAAAQERFDAIAAAGYRQGSPADSLELFSGAQGPEEVLARAEMMRRLSAGQHAVVEDLQRTRAGAANEQSLARAAQEDADQARDAAATRRSEAEGAIGAALAAQRQAQGRRAQLESERAAAQAELAAARAVVSGLLEQRAAHESWEAARHAAPEPAPDALPAPPAPVPAPDALPAPGAAPDAPAALRTPAARDVSGREMLAAGAAAVQSILDTFMATGTRSHGSGTEFAASLQGLIRPRQSPPLDPTGPADPIDPIDPVDPPAVPPANPPANPPPAPPTSDSAKVEAVVGRALSQVGVPYAWGGGDFNGPTQGVRDGGVADSHGDYLKTGFDCSGLMVYAFAGGGVFLPHYTGYQYQAGRKVPSSEMRRGDLLFYGYNGSQHVALYLGDGQVVEAAQSGTLVRVAPVNWYGLLPQVVRIFG